MGSEPVGVFAHLIPARPDDLTAVMSELNRTPGTNTDEQQARALKRILADRGLRIVEAGRG